MLSGIQCKLEERTWASIRDMEDKLESRVENLNMLLELRENAETNKLNFEK